MILSTSVEGKVSFAGIPLSIILVRGVAEKHAPAPNFHFFYAKRCGNFGAGLKRTNSMILRPPGFGKVRYASI